MSVKVIAEFCQNHNGDYTILQEMIHQAAEAGATYGKIQTIFADDLTFRERFEEGVTRDGNRIAIKRPYQPEYERLKRLELTFEQQEQFIADCRRFGLEPLTTCFTRGHVDRLASMGWREIKVASYDCGSLPLLRELASKFDHLIVSTGATYDEEIEATVALLNLNGVRFTLMHCVTIYPTPLHEMYLHRIRYLAKLSPSFGLSNHAHAARDGIKSDLAAIHLGASTVERHFTVLDPDKTRDGPVSIRPAQLREIVEFARLDRREQACYLNEHVPEFEIMLGQERRALSEQELLNRDYYRGRFATKRGERVIYNWEDVPL